MLVIIILTYNSQNDLTIVKLTTIIICVVAMTTKNFKFLIVKKTIKDGKRRNEEKATEHSKAK